MSDIKKQKSSYTELRAVDVSEHLEKKGKFSYLSWAWAVDTLLQYDASANWEYPEPTIYPDGTMMVYCVVTAFGTSRKMQLPVLNHQNKPIANPNAFEVNNAMQRCLVKTIALHGLGLYVYAGEDLPESEKPDEKMEKTKAWIAAFVDKLHECTNEDEFLALLEKTAENRGKVAQGYPDLAPGMQAAIDKAEQVIKQEVLDDDIG